MKIRELVRYWDKHARGRLTQDTYTVALSEQNAGYLERLEQLYPLKSREELIRDLVSAALDELETSFPYVQGERVVAYDEEGYEIYEDAGITPKYLTLSQKYMQELKSKTLSKVA
ncbi:pilin assembly protein [Hydrocarboniclastica marina]|uniref:Pilin assembly protein n=1 Tax=Hydrocarboniclastica marina TaxID=2259620 RepID=A0A4P7XGJ1_9ALTE|nr:pilin assembly protein [Hydrocarboniclastica marina]MAL99720.1 pilin assembly protein [Alteromonadaceae bacterium]QCF25302.1 pilin assembly protein [Hydrocarboniclastica marina]|tara:strand:+ start:3172 stop:3516 length:345 start_codon:yes stop_codon:yes gene_type:complete